jgi:hypothetical protein
LIKDGGKSGIELKQQPNRPERARQVWETLCTLRDEPPEVIAGALWRNSQQKPFNGISGASVSSSNEESGRCASVCRVLLARS